MKVVNPSKVASPLVLCRECLMLRGPVRDALGGEHTQRCDCEPKEPRWPRFDYNLAEELCYCCALERIPSGSRWSLPFCALCKPHVESRSTAGTHPIPIGRHTIMNGIWMTEDSLAIPERRIQFERTTASLFERIARVRAFHRDRVRTVVNSIPVPGPLPVDAYREYARLVLPDRSASAAALAETMTKAPAATG